MRSPVPSRVLLVAVLAVAVLLGAAVMLDGARPVGAQDAAEPETGAPIVELATPASSPLAATRAFAGMEAGTVRTAPTIGPDPTGEPATAEATAQSVIGESVIGVDGRRRVWSSATNVYPLRAIGQIVFALGTGSLCR